MKYILFEIKLSQHNILLSDYYDLHNFESAEYFYLTYTKRLTFYMSTIC